MLTLPTPLRRRRSQRHPKDQTPPPPPPAGPAVVVSVVLAPGNQGVDVTFDRPIVSAGSADPGGAIQIAGTWPEIVTRPGPPAVLRVTVGVELVPGDSWEISAQPAWVATELAVPQAGAVA
ncbi:MAG TPA: hypothetical protein VEA69_23140 [Tepidisphaeraceae bacterium]|nr:hypothetical protein [Tepidisphaeraceae bacterium]